MISRPDSAQPRAPGRILRVAVVLSVLVHVGSLLLAFGLGQVLARALPHARPRPQPSDETVTLSTAIHFEKRPRAVAAQPSHAVAPTVVARAVALRRAATAQRPAARPLHAPRTLHPVRRELAKTLPRATPAPRSAPVQVALRQPEPPARSAANGSALSAARIAQIQNDLAKSIAHDRARENPLSNVAHSLRPAATMRRYTINVAGTSATLRGAQGLCYPLRSWNTDGFIYFYVTCRTQRADGSVRDERIPWPLRYRPSQVAYGPNGPAPPPGAIPLPLPGWKLPPAEAVDPDVLGFLREHRAL